MNAIEEAIRRAQEIGGKDGLNCVAEIDTTAVEQYETMTFAEDKPLAGIPILVKDNIDVKGLHTTAGSLALADNVASKDAPVIRNLRRNGAVIIGKTNMTEFANYVSPDMPPGYSSRGGQVLHAADPKRDPSGSSTGSAVAVAAGIVPMAVGTDTSSSTVVCAMENGICALKPPVGALSGEGVIPISRTLDSVGAMARTMEDTLRLYSAMRDEPLPEIFPASLQGLRIAVNRANADVMPAEWRSFPEAVAARLAENGVVISEVDQPHLSHLMTIMKWEFRPMLEDYLRKSAASRKTLAEIVAYYEADPDTMMKYGDERLRGALYETTDEWITAPEYQEAMRGREQAREKVLREIGNCDAVLLAGPTSIMHLCGFSSVTVAGAETDGQGVRRAVILYGADELRLYRAALAVEKLLN